MAVAFLTTPTFPFQVKRLRGSAFGGKFTTRTFVPLASFSPDSIIFRISSFALTLSVHRKVVRLKNGEEHPPITTRLFVDIALRAPRSASLGTLNRPRDGLHYFWGPLGISAWPIAKGLWLIEIRCCYREIRWLGYSIRPKATLFCGRVPSWVLSRIF